MQLRDILYAGDTLDFTTSVTDYPAPVWTLRYRLAPASGAAIDLTSAAAGSDHRITANASATASWVVGTYSWTAWVENAGGERYTLARGRLDIRPASASLPAGADARTQAEIALEAIDAVLAGRATHDQAELRLAVNGDWRSVRRMTHEELMRLRRFWQRQVDAERGTVRRYVVGYR